MLLVKKLMCNPNGEFPEFQKSAMFSVKISPHHGEDP